MDILTAYHYPGNIRELENIVEHVMVFCTGDTLQASYLEKSLQPAPRDLIQKAMEADNPLMDLEREMIANVLAQTGGHYKKTAERLKLSRTTLWRKMKLYGLVDEKYVSN